ncbi:hypothetical protein ACF0H5_012880 [Mactra antiquata]
MTNKSVEVKVVADTITMSKNITYLNELGDSGVENFYTDNSTNNSFNLHHDFLLNVNHGSTTYAVILCIATIIVNMTVVVGCLKDKDARRRGYFLQIINLSVANLCIGLFVIPLTVYHVLYNWHIGSAMCRIFIISDIFLPFTSMMVMILLNIEKQVIVTHPRLHLWLFDGSLQWLIVFIPWFVSFIVVVPIWTSGSIPLPNEPGECMVPISFEAAILCPIITYFVPLLAIIVLNLRLLLIKLNTTREGGTLTVSERIILKPTAYNQTSFDAEDANDEPSAIDATSKAMAGYIRSKRDDFTAVCTANLVFCTMWFPYQFVSFLLTLCVHSTCTPSYELTQFVTWFGTSSACAVPFCWFIDNEARNVIGTCCGKSKKKKSLQRTNSNEVYL